MVTKETELSVLAVLRTGVTDFELQSLSLWGFGNSRYYQKMLHQSVAPYWRRRVEGRKHAVVALLGLAAHWAHDCFSLLGLASSFFFCLGLARRLLYLKVIDLLCYTNYYLIKSYCYSPLSNSWFLKHRKFWFCFSVLTCFQKIF